MILYFPKSANTFMPVSTNVYNFNLGSTYTLSFSNL